MSNFLRTRMNVPCPTCGRALHPTFGDVQAGRLINCPGGHSVQLVENGDSIGRVDNSIRDLNRSIAKLNRTFRRRR